MIGKTTTDKKHYHMVYTSAIQTDEAGRPLLDEVGQVMGGEGQTSENKKHSHKVFFDGNAFVIEEAEGHTHQYEQWVPSNNKKKNESEKKVVSMVKDLYTEAESLERWSRKNGEESEDFYAGNQWDKVEKQMLKEEGRPAITINETASKIDLLSGFQRQNRSDFRHFPIESGDHMTAEILDVAVKNIMDANNFELEETLVFKDQATVGRGIFHVYVDYDEDIEGKIVVEKLCWKDVYIGQHEKFDLSDCEYIIKCKTFSKAKIEQMFPDKKKEINMMFQSFKESSDEVGYVKKGKIYDYPQDAVPADLATHVDIARKEIKVLECWYKEYKTSYVVTVYDDGFVEGLELSAKEASMLETIPNVVVIRRNTFDMKVAKVAGSVLLDQYISDWSLPDFPIIPVYAKKIDEKFWGKVEDIKDVQREINKSHSQAVEAVSKMANYMYMIDDRSFTNDRDMQDFTNNASKPGFVAKIADVGRPPVKVEGGKMPSELVAMESVASEKLRQIMNVPMEASGFSEREVSGRAIIEKRRQTLVANEFLFDNMNLAKKKLARNVLALLQDVYTPERIARLVLNSKPIDDLEAMENKFTYEEIIKLLENKDLLKYDIHVAQSPHSETIRSANFSVWAELVGQGFPLPPSELVRMSDLPDKNRVIQLLTQQQQAAAQAEEAKNQVEIQKTLIAAQSKQQGAVQ